MSKVEKVKVEFTGVESTNEIAEGVSVVSFDEKLYTDKAKEAGIDKDTINKLAKFDEAYLNAAVANAVETATTIMADNKSIKEVKVHTPFGLTKSDVIKTNVLGEVKVKVPASDKVITRSDVKNIVQTTRFNVTKAQMKRLQTEATDKLVAAGYINA